MRAWLVSFPASAQRLLAWLVVLVGPALFLALAGSMLWTGWHAHQRVAGLQFEHDQLSGRVQAQLVALSERSESRPLWAAASPDQAREQFLTDYTVFLETLEAAGIDISQATGIGEVDIGAGIRELNAAWGGSAPMQALLVVLATPELSRASISEFSIRATPIEGHVDVFIEFRSAFLLDGQE